MHPGLGSPYRGMGPQMMRQVPSGLGGPQMRPFGFGGGAPMRMNPLMGGARQPAKSGGFLANLFGKGSSGGAGLANMRGPANAAGGGFLKSLTNPGSINQFLTNTQQVLKTAQQFGPMVQQYGPLVKNLPAMWKLYRGFKDLPDQEDQAEEQDTIETSSSIITQKPISSQRRTTTRSRAITTDRPRPHSRSERIASRESRPKLFI